MARIYVGMGGFSYPAWKDNFYPGGLSAKKELHYASRQVTSIEINSSFYRYQSPKTYERWYEETPADFCFAIKGPRTITHDQRLIDPESSLSNFLASGLLRLGEKMGPILWQFPPTFTFKKERLENFLAMLPKDFASAVEVAKHHSERMIGRVFLEPTGNHPLRHAFEFRHPSFKSPELTDLLRTYGHALVFSHSPQPPAFYAEDLTSDFVYWRLHGSEAAYLEKGYSARDINWFASRSQLWSQGNQADDAQLIEPDAQKSIKMPRDIYIYFDNEAKDYAPSHAVALLKKLQKKSEQAA